LEHELEIGQLLDSRFEITALIAQSGMATVFAALDQQTGQTVAIKVPHTGFGSSRTSLGRLAHEAAVLGRLDHFGIPKIIPIVEKSRPYVVMECLEGETLYDLLQRRHPLPVCEALQLVSRLCGILEHVHQQGVIHRDIKPGNIIISKDGTPHIIDFGISKMTAREPIMFGWFSPKMTGTPEYMAPEQIQGDRTDVRTDIYSLGAMLYEIVTGTPPFQQDGKDENIEVRLAGAPQPPRELNKGVTEEIEEIILHAMAPRPADRYSSAAAMKADLDFPEGVQVKGAYRTPLKASAWPKRLRVAAFVLSLLAAPVILFFIFLLLFQRQLAQPPKGRGQR
jgi:eukaryotic-like serine/threonine-protein kinase